MKFGNVNIRPFTENDILNKVRWINDCENNKFLHYELPLDEDKTRAWFHKNKIEQIAMMPSLNMIEILWV